jgi:hypothetical protein
MATVQKFLRAIYLPSGFLSCAMFSVCLITGLIAGLTSGCTVLKDDDHLTLVSLTPLTGPISVIPTSIVATFSVGLDPSKTTAFIIGGTCSPLPTVSSVALNHNTTIATATLTGGTCAVGQTLTVAVDPTKASSANANTAGTGSAVIRTYTFGGTPPTLVSLTPTDSIVGLNPTSMVAVFSKAITALTPANFVFSGTCSTLPNKGSVVMSAANTTATLALSGGVCTNAQTLIVSVDPTSVADSFGLAGTGSIATSTFTTDTTGPTAALAAPSATSLNSVGTTTVALTYAASAAGATALTGTLTAGGGGVTVTTLTGNPSCTLAVSSITVAGATLTLSSCTGNGTLSMHVNAATAKDGLNNTSTVSNESSIITVDNTGPVLASLNPATTHVNPTPTSIIAVFSEPMTALTAAKFTLGGTCTVLPTKGAVTMTAGNTTATLALSGGTCTDAQTLTANVNPTTVSDSLGNVGTGGAVTRTYTVTTVGPSASLGAPSKTYFKSGTNSTIALTFTPSAAGGTALTGTLTAGGGGVTLTTLTGSPSCIVAVTGITTAGATITLSACGGNGTFTVHVNAATAKDSLNNLSTVSPESSTITIDNTAPTFSSSSPASGSTFFTVPTAVSFTFSEPVNSVAGNYSLASGTCDTNPSVASISGSGTSTITVNLSGGTCTGSETVSLVANLAAITDLAGNFGVGTQTVTLTNIPSKFIFATAALFAGNMGGIAGADSLCASDANKPNANVYKALLVDGASRVGCTTASCGGGNGEHVDWPIAATTRYIQTDGSTVIGLSNATHLFTFPLTSIFSGTVALSTWTGLETDWTSHPSNCILWNNSTVGFDSSTGLSNVTGAGAISSSTSTCDASMPMICVEQ